MHGTAASVEEFLAGLPDGRREIVVAVRNVVNEHLPDGYVEQMDYGMVSWVVPLETQPDTYNGRPLCYAALASHKQHVSVYLMGLYTDGPELGWFRQQYADREMKLDMGKSCVRFKHLEDIALDVLGEVIAMIPVDEYVARHAAARGER